MTSVTWGTVLSQAIAAIRNNTPPPVIPPMSDIEIAAAIDSAIPSLIAVRTYIQARPGVLTAAGLILGALPFAWARYAQNIIYSLPQSLDTAIKYAPTITNLLTEFAPAATGIASDSRGR